MRTYVYAACAAGACALTASANHIDFIVDGEFTLAGPGATTVSGDPGNILGGARFVGVTVLGGSASAEKLVGNDFIDFTIGLSAPATLTLSYGDVTDGNGPLNADFTTDWNAVVVEVLDVGVGGGTLSVVFESDGQAGVSTRLVNGPGVYEFLFAEPGYEFVDFTDIDTVTAQLTASPGGSFRIGSITRELVEGQVCPGDLDGDLDVDSADLNILLADFGCEGAGCTGDVDGLGGTNSLDLNILLANFGNTCFQEGACCLFNGDCEIVPEAFCVGFGVYQGDDTNCGDVRCAPEPTGACCVEGFCNEGTQTQCLAVLGIYQGDGTSCDDSPCGGDPVGACCLTGGCAETSEADCVLAMGEYQGDGASCDGVMCDETIEGACCFPDESCSVLDGIDCVNAGGEFQGIDVPCGPGTCSGPSPTGACCVFDICTDDATEQACLTLGGTFGGAGSVCADDPCGVGLTGACCLFGQCVEVPAAVCASSGGVFQGEGTTCDEVNCN